MKPNVGGADRIARFVVGAALLLIGLLAPLTTTARVVLFVIGAIAIFTATIRYCPINAALHINTRDSAQTGSR